LIRSSPRQTNPSISWHFLAILFRKNITIYLLEKVIVSISFFSKIRLILPLVFY
jgi:hypothetical protein